MYQPTTIYERILAPPPNEEIIERRKAVFLFKRFDRFQ